MKKFIKFLLGIGAIVGGVMGILYYFDRRKKDEFDDFNDDEFDDIFKEDDRDYVTLDFDEKEEENTEKKTSDSNKKNKEK